ncbi:MAG: hypothetical protein E5299_01498 [Burkholderia gladioli]|nr:MAG: hypothetical protein E5299_01498 [Burkholderia gladioli]
MSTEKTVDVRTFNGVVITDETIKKTRQWYADNAAHCIAEAESGTVRVNDLDEYRKWRQQQAARSLDGLDDHTFAFLQRAYFIQTGESVPLFAPARVGGAP